MGACILFFVRRIRILPAAIIRKFALQRLEARIGAERFEVRVPPRLCRRRPSLLQR